MRVLLIFHDLLHSRNRILLVMIFNGSEDLSRISKVLDVIISLSASRRARIRIEWHIAR